MGVFVTWYNKILPGELLDGEYLGMKQVLIPLDGHHVVALFKESHIYASADEADKNRELSNKKPVFSNETRPFSNNNKPLSENNKPSSEIFQPQLSDEIIERREETSRLALKFFKEEHWDHKHNHLRTDSLETFYMFWRNAHGGHRADYSRYTVAVDPAMPGGDHSAIVPVSSDSVGKTPAATATVPVASSTVKPQPKKLTKNQLRSTSTIQFNDSVQTSIFDLL